METINFFVYNYVSDLINLLQNKPLINRLKGVQDQYLEK